MPDRSTGDRVADPELEAEQSYLSFAYDCLDEMRRTVERLLATDAGVNAAAREALQDMFAARLLDLESDRSLCFGRIDRSDGDRYYIGRRHVRDVEGDPVVIDWRAPVAEAFYQASATDPFGLERRRSFQTDGPRLLAIADDVFADMAAAHERGVPPTLVRAGDALLADLTRARTGSMRDVVATIQAEQDRVIRLPGDGVLVVQGAPGTGKTAVGLHRAAFLLYRMREERSRGGVLVVGPNRAFMRYIERVLPSLGETTVVQSAVDSLASIQLRGEDAPEVLRLKGDPRMADVIRRAARHRVRAGVSGAEVRAAGRTVAFAGADALRAIDRAFATGLPYREARDVFVSAAAAELVRAATRRAGGRATASETEAVRAELAHEPSFRSLMDRMWPSVSATELVRDLLSVRAQLTRAGEGLLSATEIDLLVRRGAGRVAEEPWTSGDVALVDEAQWRIGGVPRTYSHVIVDEVQDLSPMEMRMIGRRASTGAMTLLGDLAQAIGEWSYPDWDALLAHLPSPAPFTVETLSIGYRVPRQMIDLASALLPRIAPGLSAPVSIRDGEPPTVVRTDAPRLAHAVVREMRVRSKVGGSVGVIVPEGLRHALEAAARAGRVEFDGADWGRGRTLTIMSAREAKGLEFDHVILVEPAELLTEGDRGFRELYVALTRATKTLLIVAALELPEGLRALAATAVRPSGIEGDA